ncbi:cardiolipin synthase isoform X2 [Lycorma delicatula]
MISTCFIRSHNFKTTLSSLVTCPTLKFSSNLKPQACCNTYNLFHYSSIVHCHRKFNMTHNCWNKSLVDFNLIKSYYFYKCKRLFCISIINSDNLFKNNDFHSCKASSELNSSVFCPYLFYNYRPCDILCRRYSNNKKTIVSNKHLAIKRPEYIKGVLGEKQRRIKQTQQQLKRSGKLFLDDIKETKSKMKEKMEEIIERENVWTVPNMLCIARIAVSPYLGYLIMHSDYNLALGLVMLAGVTDLLDGLIARSFKSQSSKLGSFLDPMADKVLLATLFLSLTIAGSMPVPLTALIITRDVMLAAAGFYIRYQSLPPPRTLSRYFDMTHATAQLTPTKISKINTTIQLMTGFLTLSAAALGLTEHPALHAL